MAIDEADRLTARRDRASALSWAYGALVPSGPSRQARRVCGGLKRLMVLRVVALGIALVALMAAACGGGEDVTEVSLVCPSRETPRAPPDVASLSPGGVYEWMAESMTCPGYALKVVTRQESEIVDPEEGALSGTEESNTWIDFSADRARGETRTELVSSDRDGNVIEEHKDSTV